MVFTKIQIVRGIVVSSSVIRVWLGHRRVELYNKWKGFRSTDNGELDDAFANWLIEENVISKMSKAIGLDIYTWPCCSELNNKMFVIGRKITEHMIEDIFDKVEIPVFKSFEDMYIQKICQGQDIHGKIQNVLLLDDCISCS